MRKLAGGWTELDFPPLSDLASLTANFFFLFYSTSPPNSMQVLFLPRKPR